MSQGVAIVLGVFAACIVFGIPITLLTVFERRRARAFAALTSWASSRGLSESEVSVVPPGLASQGPALNMTLDDGVLSITSSESRQHAYVTFYYRPRAKPPLITFSLQRRMWGAAGKPLGDAQLDPYYLVLSGAPDDVRALLRAKVREHLVQHSQECWSLSQHDGTWTHVQVGKLIDHEARDRALQLLRLLASG